MCAHQHNQNVAGCHLAGVFMLDAAELHLADFTGLNDGREVKVSI